MKYCRSYPVNLAVALRVFGGFVKYYHSTESLQDLAKVSAGVPYRRVLACCGGGDQVLTLMGARNGGIRVDAVDMNPAQLFVLAAKACFLVRRKQAPFLPSFRELLRAYPKQVFAVPSDLRSADRLYDQQRKVFIAAPALLRKRFAIECDSGTFDLDSFRPFWSDDGMFVSKVRSNVKHLRFLKADILDVPLFFSLKPFDLLYLSDIAILHSTPYHIERLRRLVALVRPGGIVVGSVDHGENYLRQGAAFIEIIRKNARGFRLTEVKRTKMHVVLQHLAP